MIEKKLLLDSSKNPFDLFEEWFEEASIKEINDHNAMNLSTVSKDFKPSSRMVLLKSYNNQGFVFYTNTKSKKGNFIKSKPYVALNFHWKTLLRQIRIEGKAIKVSNKEADEYFATRPKKSQIAAWASDQSSELKDREILNKKIDYFQKKFKNIKSKRPSHWTGYRVKPELIEFWQDMPYRLHDRLEYKKNKNKWIVRRLFP